MFISVFTILKTFNLNFLNFCLEFSKFLSHLTNLVFVPNILFSLPPFLNYIRKVLGKESKNERSKVERR